MDENGTNGKGEGKGRGRVRTKIVSGLYGMW